MYFNIFYDLINYNNLPSYAWSYFLEIHNDN